MGNQAFQIDTSRWPLVILTLRGELTTDEYEAMLDASEKINARGRPYVGVVDLRELKAAANAAQRKLIAGRIRDMERKYGDVAVANVMIVTSPLIRGALMAVEWLRFRKKRDHWVATMDEALDVATKVCDEHGLPTGLATQPPNVAEERPRA
jgi:hypothetical protein